METPKGIKDLMIRLERKEVDKPELIRLLNRVSKVPNFANSVAFFGHNIRLSRLRDLNCPESEIEDTQAFLYSAFKIYYSK